ncbi:Signal transduction histidine kinase [Lutibacter agarilyticus]|uniref:histidine kinase n=1 Tax=Lutibacter agarilyticus TaxID=1109740 RepID=A0A238Z5E2_9FLAO|nr:hybrid sensor histidine kinase/response regulator transcription factor [Lutibacter agarilyticus]SNR78053.1 Signal transduction histidine kinase [Lutibacter agarilyticus]
MNKLVRKYIFVSLFLLLHLSMFSQWRLNQIAGDEGLSNNTVTSIIQDRDGYLWFGTFNGLNKYDGYSMKQFNFASGSSGLSSNVIFKLFEDKDGFVWVGTEAGLNRINTKTGKIDVYFKGSNEPTYSGKSVIHQSKTGVFFINTTKGIKFFEIDSQGKLEYDYFLKKYDDINLNIQNLIASANGKYWFLTPSAKVKLHQVDIIKDGKTPKLNFDATDYTKPIFGKDEIILDMLEYPKNTIWVVNNNLELLKIKLNDDLKVIESKKIALRSGIRNEQLKVQRSVNLCSDNEGRIWIAGNGLFLNYNTESGEINNLSQNNQLKKLIGSQEIKEIFIDNSNILWLCTLNNGLYKMDLDNHTFYNSTEYLNYNTSSALFKSPILSMCEDQKGNFWFGTQGGTVAVLGKNGLQHNLLANKSKSPNIDSYSISVNNTAKTFITPEVKRLMRDRKGAMWVGAMNGLSRVEYNEASHTFKIKTFDSIKDNQGNSIQSRVFAIEEDKNDAIWFGAWENGLVKMTFNEQNNSYHTVNYRASLKDSTSLSNNNIRDILEDSQGNIWVGTINGLNRLIHSEMGDITFERFYSNLADAISLSNDYIMDIYEAKDGNLYVGTYGGGVNRIKYADNGAIEFKHFTVENGLPSNVVYQIREDFEGNIWLMHSREISKLNPHNETIIYFEKKDGFNVDEFMDSAMEFTSTGTMLCGGVNGFTFFNPNSLTVNTQKPQLTITDFKLFNESVKVNEEIEGRNILTKGINKTTEIVLPYNLNSFEFVFSSMHFSNPEKNKYKFILEGFEEKQQTSMGKERRFASYTNVPPGNYIFKVYGSNSSGIWNDVPKQIKIKITPPWYLTTTAILFFIALFFAIIYIIIKVRWHQIKLKNDLKLESALHEKSEEINQMKLRFFTNISHELRTPLTLIIGPLEQIMKGSNDEQYLQRLNAIMYKNSTRLLRLINQLLDFRKAESSNINLIVEQGNLVNFIEEIYHAFEEIALERNIDFTFKTTEKTIDAWFDNDKIEKIIYNLLSNAFKFTEPNKKIELSIETETKNAKDYAIINVVDEGIGIASDDLSGVFERFYQVKKESNTIQMGSGLGLAYTKRLVEIHKGTINIHSIIEKGTTCTIAIPISKIEYEQDSILEVQPKQYDFSFIKNEIKDFKDILSESSNTSKTVTHKNETQTILVVEDNKDLREYLFDYFQNFYKVLVAPNGEEGLKIALEKGPDLIISDLMMPKMNGIEMCKKIKNDITTSHIPVIILTAKAGIENEKEGLETGADEFVLKPFNMEVLKLRVHNILRTKQQWAEKFKTKPTSSTWKELSSKLDQEFLKKSLEIIKKNIDNPDYSVEKFALDVGMSRSALFKKIKSITGESTSEFIRTIRIKRASNLIQSGQYSITEVVFMVGFSDPKYFRTCFKKQFGATPSEYLKSFRSKV